MMTIKDNQRTITLPLQRKLSSTRASWVIATTGGFKNLGVYKGENVRVSVNVIVDNDFSELLRTENQANYLSGYKEKQP